MSMALKTKCPFCFNRTFRLRFDKKNKPFFCCTFCKHKVFIMNKVALLSVISWCTTLERIDSSEVKNILCEASEVFNTVKQSSEACKQWEETDKAQEYTLEDVFYVEEVAK